MAPFLGLRTILLGIIVLVVTAHVPGWRILVVAVTGKVVPRLRTPDPIKQDWPSGATTGPGIVRVIPASIEKYAAAANSRVIPAGIERLVLIRKVPFGMYIVPRFDWFAFMDSIAAAQSKTPVGSPEYGDAIMDVYGYNLWCSVVVGYAAKTDWFAGDTMTQIIVNKTSNNFFISTPVVVLIKF